MSSFASFFIGIAATIAGLFGYHINTDTAVDNGVRYQATTKEEQPAPPSGVTVSVSAATDAQLSNDLNGLDAQIKASTDESVSIDASLSDKPIPQTE